MSPVARRATLFFGALLLWPLLSWAQLPVRTYILQNAAAANGGGTVAHALGYSIANVQVVIPTGASPTFTVNFEQSLNDIHYTATLCNPLTAALHVSSTTATGQWWCDITGSLWFRARVSGYTGPGSVTVLTSLMPCGYLR